MSDVRYDCGKREWVGVLEFDAEELRNVAAGLASNDVGAKDMEDLADRLDLLNGEEEE